MKFGLVPTQKALGHILAHSQKLADGTLRKGRVLQSDDIQRLQQADVLELVCAQLSQDDVGEDEAAELLAQALVASSGTLAENELLRIGAPFTGRCNIFANGSGLLEVDATRIDAVNRVHESLTVATLPTPMIVSEKQMLATVKLIAFSVPRVALEEAIELLHGAQAAVHIHAFIPRRVALIQTRLAGTRENVLDKTVRVLQARIEALGSTLISQSRCAHNQSAVAEQITEKIAAGCEMLLICGASAIVDRRDVIPASVVASGGQIRHFGMPVDPGNLLLLAHHGDTPVLGLPGCARSPKYNGLDLVLERIAAGLEVNPQVITSMGVGGLLKEIAERPQPRLGQSAPAQAPRVSAVVLAGGQSRRMGAINKLLAPVDGVAMVLASVRQILSAQVDEVLVVTGYEAGRVREALAGEAVRIVHNEDFDQGLSTSMSCGIAALGEDIDAALVCLGDMPRVSGRDIQRLIAAFDPIEGRSICVPTFNGKRGNPVLWDRRYFQQMREVRGDVGARHLIGEFDAAVCEVAMDDGGVLLDVDSPQALAEINSSS